MKYSVVVPFFNTGEKIRNAIYSVSRQKHDSIELILINDGSTDNTPDIVKDAIEQIDIPVLLLEQQNAGPGAARNTGINEADGEYICFLDSDDFWFEGKISRIDNKVESGHDLVCHDLLQINARNQCKDRLICGPHADFRELLFNGNPVLTSGSVVKRSFIYEVGGFDEDPDIVGIEDYDLWLTLAKRGYIFEYLNEPLGAYSHEDGISSNLFNQYINSNKVFNKHYSKMSKKRGDFIRYIMRFAEHTYNYKRAFVP
jgi:glycosyltransferase involved in cell wall biosynthesis